VKPQQERSKFRLGQTVGLLAMIRLADAAMTGGRIHREVVVGTAHIFAAAYEEGATSACSGRLIAASELAVDRG
jgi:hypothetical protein